MAKAAKKTKKVEVEEVSQPLEQIGELNIAQEKYEECEWCFQFDGEEPQVFAWTDDSLNKDEDPKVVFTVTNTKNSYISFTKDGRTFAIFARELTDMGKQLREKQRESFIKANEENESTNKEA